MTKLTARLVPRIPGQPRTRIRAAQPRQRAPFSPRDGGAGMAGSPARPPGRFRRDRDGQPARRHPRSPTLRRPGEV